jgi:hypothetical protein
MIRIGALLTGLGLLLAVAVAIGARVGSVNASLQLLGLGGFLLFGVGLVVMAAGIIDLRARRR